MKILAIDPGSTQSALVGWDGSSVLHRGIYLNPYALNVLLDSRPMYDALAIEQVACYGMAVGKPVFETVFWCGRFYQVWRKMPIYRIERKKIKLHICGNFKAKNANVRQALIDRFGEPGTKKKPGTLHGVKTHLWAAMAVAVTVYDQEA